MPQLGWVQDTECVGRSKIGCLLAKSSWKLSPANWHTRFNSSSNHGWGVAHQFLPQILLWAFDDASWRPTCHRTSSDVIAVATWIVLSMRHKWQASCYGVRYLGRNSSGEEENCDAIRDRAIELMEKNRNNCIVVCYTSRRALKNCIQVCLQ